jgi:hypothetical protein
MTREWTLEDNDFVAFDYALRHLYNTTFPSRKSRYPSNLVCVKGNELTAIAQQLGKSWYIVQLLRQPICMIGYKKEIAREQYLGALAPLALKFLHGLILGNKALLIGCTVNYLLDEGQDPSFLAPNNLYDVPHNSTTLRKSSATTK